MSTVTEQKRKMRKSMRKEMTEGEIATVEPGDRWKIRGVTA